MSKFNLLVMGGAVGLLCVGSPAVLAQVSPPGWSKTNVSETKPPFKIPNGGNFKYKGKSSQGEFLLMEVKWQAAGTQPNTDKTRISGDVKYKNPKTEKIDVRTIDGSKSYITKTGELFFALNDVDAKVYGPVDLIALKVASLGKSDKPAEDKVSGPGGSGAGGDPSKTQGSGPLTRSDTPVNDSNDSSKSSETEADEDVEPDFSNSESPDSVSKSANKGGVTVNDKFKVSGSFTEGNYKVKWKQANFVKGKIYPQGSKAITYSISLVSGGSVKPFLENLPSLLGKDGRVTVYTYNQATKKPVKIQSKKHFFSDNYAFLIKATNQINKEHKHIKAKGLKSLRTIHRNHKDEIVGTDGTVMLGALVKQLAPKRVAQKKGTTAAALFDAINAGLKLSSLSQQVHVAAHMTGLRVVGKKGARSLKQGVAQDRPLPPEADPMPDNDFAALVNGLPERVFDEAVADYVGGLGNDLIARDTRIRGVRGIILGQMNDAGDRDAYVFDVAHYLDHRYLRVNNIDIEDPFLLIYALQDHALNDNLLFRRLINRVENDRVALEIRARLVEMGIPGWRADELRRILRQFPGLAVDWRVINQQAVHEFERGVAAAREAARIREQHRLQHLRDIERGRAVLNVIIAIGFVSLLPFGL